MKSHVGIEKKICIITGKLYETGSILLDKRLQKTLYKETVTGYGISPEAQKILDDGYIVLIVVKNKVDNTKNSERILMKTEEADRTGELIYLKKTVALEIGITEDINYIDEDVAAFLKRS